VDSLVVNRLVDRHTNLLGYRLVSHQFNLVQHLRQSLVEGPYCVRLSLQMSLIQLYPIFKFVDFPRAKMKLLWLLCVRLTVAHAVATLIFDCLMNMGPN